MRPRDNGGGLMPGDHLLIRSAQSGTSCGGGVGFCSGVRGVSGFLTR